MELRVIRRCGREKHGAFVVFGSGKLDRMQRVWIGKGPGHGVSVMLCDVGCNGEGADVPNSGFIVDSLSNQLISSA